MRTFIAIMLFLLALNETAFAQAPNRISYQAVIRDSEGNLVKNQSIGMAVVISSGDGLFKFMVYRELHNPQTNENGLISIEIGGGSPTLGTLEDIDWSNGSYFIGTSIDLNGGTDYTITSGSQILSVPYALFAKSTNETDPVYSASVASGITENDTSKWNNKQDKIVYSIGDEVFNGIVCWVDETGQHGLVCSKYGFSEPIRWYAGTNMFTMACGNGFGAGEMNTAIIVSKQGRGDGDTYAALACLEVGWYLPSIYELELIRENIATVNAALIAKGGNPFANAVYWSSTEIIDEPENYMAHALNMGTNPSSVWHQKKSLYMVRGVRCF